MDAGGDDETLALRLVELLGDDAVIRRLRTALYPQMLADKMDRQSALMEQLIAQLTASNTRIQDLEKRVKDLEDQADKTEQYTRRSNLLFSGLPETGVGEDTEEKILEIVNGKMGVQPPLSAHDIARSHRLSKRRDDKHCRPVIVRFGSDRVRDRVFRARTALKGFMLNNYYIHILYYHIMINLFVYIYFYLLFMYYIIMHNVIHAVHAFYAKA